MPVSSTPTSTLAVGLYDLVTGDEDARLCRDIPEAACDEQAGNFLLQAAALSMSKIGDRLADPKIVLPWLLGAVAAPDYLIGLLVPVRESLSLLPQMVVGGAIRRFAVRKWFWVIGSIAQGLCILAMAALAAAGIVGGMAGWLVLALLAAFSIARGIASVSAKDTLGKTVSKTRRGRVNGLSETIAGVMALLAGLYFVLVPATQRTDGQLFGLIALAGVAWLLGAACFARIREVPGATEGDRDLASVLKGQLGTLLRDAELRRFLFARSLLLSTALAGPAYVALAHRHSHQSLSGLGGLVIATGLAGVVSSFAWGRLSDRSSRLTMAAGALLAGLLGLTVGGLAVAQSSWLEQVWLHAVVIFVLGIAHGGVRIGRKTQLVDMAGSDRRAAYVALSNTVIGGMLLLAGALSAALMSISLTASILALAVLALAAAGATLRLSEAHR